VRISQRLPLIDPVYPKAGKGRAPVGLERMLRIYFVQQWFNLLDPGAEETLYDSLTMRRFAGINLGLEPARDELHEGPLPRARQKREPAVRDLRAEQSVHRASAIIESSRGLARPIRCSRCKKSRKCRKSPAAKTASAHSDVRINRQGHRKPVNQMFPNLRR
jgi:hypothetical protein